MASVLSTLANLNDSIKEATIDIKTLTLLESNKKRFLEVNNSLRKDGRQDTEPTLHKSREHSGTTHYGTEANLSEMNKERVPEEEPIEYYLQQRLDEWMTFKEERELVYSFLNISSRIKPGKKS